MPQRIVYGLSGASDWVLSAAYVSLGMAHDRHLFAQGGTVDISETQTRWIVLGFGLAMVLAKLGDTFLRFKKEYDTLNKDSDHGKLEECVASRAVDKRRYDEQVDSLTEMLKISRDSEDHLRDSVASLTAVIASYNETIAKVARQSARNTANAIEKIAAPEKSDASIVAVTNDHPEC